jgi:uncharacterized membrane protein
VTQNDIDEAEWRSPANWHGGPLRLYASRRDSRAFVPKRASGLGVTINFANRTGVAFLVGALIFVLVLTFVTRRQR